MEKKVQKVGTIRQKVFLKASPMDVFNAFMNPKIHSAFTGAKATGLAKVGSKITAWDGYIWGKNLKLQKGKMIVQEWKTSEFPDGYSASKLSITLKKKGKGTQLTMVHSNVPKSKMRSFASGWNSFYWKPLNKYFSKF